MLQFDILKPLPYCAYNSWWVHNLPRRNWYCTHIAHQCTMIQCCDQLTAVKTVYLVTRITWSSRGIKYQHIETEYSFGSYPLTSKIKIHMKYVMLMCALLKFWFQSDLRHENSVSYYLLQAEKTVAFDFSHHGQRVDHARKSPQGGAMQ